MPCTGLKLCQYDFVVLERIPGLQGPTACTIQRPFIPQAVKTLAAAGCDMVILSDANTVFINEIVDHHGLSQHFLAVCSPNPFPQHASGLLTWESHCQDSCPATSCLVDACALRWQC